MNWYFVSAAVLTIVIGLIHSFLGEQLIFRPMRLSGWIPTNGSQVLRKSHVGILWASWHAVTALGIGMALVLFWLALPSSNSANHAFITTAIAGSMFASSSLVLIGTKGKHPGWAGLLCVAALAARGAYG